MSLAACGGKTGATAEPDSLLADTVAVEEVTNPTADAANGVVALLQEQLQSADPAQVKGIVQTVTDKVKELLKLGDVEGVETYTAVISNFIAENAPKLKELGITESLTNALAGIEGLPTDVAETAKQAAEGVKSAALTSAISAIASGESVMDAVKAAAAQVMTDGTDAANQAAAAVDAAKAAAEAAPEAVKEAAKAKAEEVKEQAKQQATDAANKAIDDAAAAAKKKLGL